MTFSNRWPLSSDVTRTLHEELLRAFADPFFTRAASSLTAGSGVFPAVNLFDDGEKFLVRAELPGVDRESLDVTTQGDQLIVRGERKIQTAAQNANYHRRECEGGQFRRVISLPQAVDSQNIQATYKNGIL